MTVVTLTLTFPGAMLQCGFWLYVWRVVAAEGEFLYVGRTGDNSSPSATPPYQRMGQHLGHNEKQNALRLHLEKRGIKPEQCLSFQMIAHGPLFPKARNMASHRAPRDIVAALEMALADSLKAAGYEVLNIVRCRKSVDSRLFADVKTAFADHFPRLQNSE